jgi:hypothetical protein
MFKCNRPVLRSLLVLSAMLISVSAYADNKVNVGGPDADFIGPGVDSNWSMIAIDRDGEIKGQFIDIFQNVDGGGSLHGAITCLVVIGNEAWMGGIVTIGLGPEEFGGRYVVGSRFLAHVVDNGTSALDPPDQISFTFDAAFEGGDAECTDLPELGPLLDFTEGQVKIH